MSREIKNKKMTTKIKFKFILFFLNCSILLFLGCSKKEKDSKVDTVTDIEGNIYSTIKIGNQVWMAENLKVTKFRNGDPISNITNMLAWENCFLNEKAAYCDIKNDPNYKSEYGRLYNWYSVNDIRKLAPTGWHIPTQSEFNTLVMYLGGYEIAGGKLKEMGTIHWNNPNSGATNETRFNGIPAGVRVGQFDLEGKNLAMWTSTDLDNFYAWHFRLLHDNIGVAADDAYKNEGMSIRCIKDY